MIFTKSLISQFVFIFLFTIFIFGCKNESVSGPEVRGCPYIYAWYIDSSGSTHYPIDYYSAIHYELIIPFDEALEILKKEYGEPNYSISGLLYESHSSTKNSYTILEEIGSILILHRKVVGKINIAKGWILSE